MMKPRTFFRLFFPLLLVVMFALSLQACVVPGSGGSRPASPPVDDTPPVAPRTIKEVDGEIDQLKRKITDMRDFETQQRQIGAINDVQNHSSRGWTKGDGKPSYEDLADQGYAQAAAAEKEVQRLERELARVEKEKQAILSESRGCFPPDTLVKMEDGTFKPFGRIEVGDGVLTYDIGYERLVSRPVVALYSVEADHLYTINGELTTTGGERLLTREGWEKVRNLQKGDAIHVDGGLVEIVTIEYHRANRTLYNMQVEDTHNFYVVTPNGARYLVHNSSGGGGGGSK